MKTVAFVPIRLNSRRVAGKNLRPLGDRPLMCYVLETLVKVPRIDEIYVYCSQDIVRQYLPNGVKFLKRSASLDSDETTGSEIYEAFTREVDADVYLLVHTTSPFIQEATIENALNKVLDEDYDSAFSYRKIQTFAWYDGKPLNYDLKHIPHTETLKPVIMETSAFFIFRREVWTEHRQRIGQHPYLAQVSKTEELDIDWPEDFEFAEQLLRIVPQRGK